MKKNDSLKTTENPLAEMMGEKDDSFADDFNLDDLDLVNILENFFILFFFSTSFTIANLCFLNTLIE